MVVSRGFTFWKSWYVIVRNASTSKYSTEALVTLEGDQSASWLKKWWLSVKGTSWPCCLRRSSLAWASVWWFLFGWCCCPEQMQDWEIHSEEDSAHQTSVADPWGNGKANDTDVWHLVTSCHSIFSMRSAYVQRLKFPLKSLVFQDIQTELFPFSQIASGHLEFQHKFGNFT